MNLEFLYENLNLRGFGSKWIDGIRSVTHAGPVGVTVNDVESSFFITSKGLRQGDPLSLIMFNLVVDAFSRMLVKVCRAGLVGGLCPDFVPRGVISRQYADDTSSFLENDERIAINLK